MKDTTVLSMEEAVKKVKSAVKEKFTGTVELHINLDLDPKKTEQAIRYTTVLPNGTGKTKKVAVLASKKVPNADLELTEEDISKLESGKIRPKVDFDVLVSEPRFMPKLAKAARVLGPVGAMPNPKTGTVSEDVEKAVEQIKKGKVEIKTEKDASVIHTLIGKTSFTEEALVQNMKEVFNTLRQNKPAKSSPEWIKSAYICTTMGSSVRVDVSSYIG